MSTRNATHSIRKVAELLLQMALVAILGALVKWLFDPLDLLLHAVGKLVGQQHCVGLPGDPADDAVAAENITVATPNR